MVQYSAQPLNASLEEWPVWISSPPSPIRPEGAAKIEAFLLKRLPSGVPLCSIFTFFRGFDELFTAGSPNLNLLGVGKVGVGAESLCCATNAVTTEF